MGILTAGSGAVGGGNVMPNYPDETVKAVVLVSSALKAAVTHYTYTPAKLPHMDGTDAVAVRNGKILVSASAPGTSGKAKASAPAVFTVTPNAGAKTAAAAPFFADNATATGVNAPNAGKKVTLALTDPDSNLVVPSSSPKFAGDFVLNSQGDQELIFAAASGQNLQVLGTINLTTGALSSVTVIGPLTPKGMVFVP